MGDSEDLSGRTVGEFVLRERIDAGGFGAVYRCEQPLLGREAVVKVLHQRLRRNDIVLQRFMREAQLASRLNHPYAAHVYAFGIEHADGLFWIAMEMVQGITLNHWLRERGPLPLDQFVPFFERVAEVVQTAHERGIVHRDLKPANVMVIERAGRLLPKLLDFGVAKLLDDSVLPESTPNALQLRRRIDNLDPDGTVRLGNPSEAATLTGTAVPPQRNGHQLRLTHDEATVGSPPYMSPEQWNNAGAVGPASDLYALGVVAYETLTGRRPFQGATITDYVELHCNANVPPLGGNFPPQLDRMFQKALAKRPEDRFATALELAAGLRVASGVGSSWADLPRLDESVRDAWLADAPQPLAESIAALDGARNAWQARDAADELVRNLLRYLIAIALATHAQVRADRTDPALLELVRTMRRRDLGERERVRLLRLLVRPLTSRRGAHPLPELVDLVTTRPDGTDDLDPILALHASTDHTIGGTEDIVRAKLGRMIPELTQLLRRATFVLDYVLVVPRNHAAERWAGLRRQHRALATVFEGELVKDHPMLLDREGRICVDLWPLMQTVSPTEGAEPELFLFDGRGRHGALLIAAPAGFEHHDPSVWEWIAARVIAEVDANPELGGDDQPPYLGLTSYATSDAGRFVGRESEVDAFLNRLRQRPLQVVVGPSGAGKSSFVHAGVLPGLPSSWRTVTVRPGGAPLTALASRLAAANITNTDLRLLLESSPAAAAVLIAHAALSGTIVIVIDQLEELFTLCTSPEERAQFAAVIAQLAASADAPIRVICAIRDDFLMQLDALASLRPLLSPSLVLLGNPSRDTLVRIVTEPARRAGYALSDPELAQDMVSAVADRPGALALLSFTASRLWELRDRRFRQLTRKAYDAMGGIGGALGRHAEATLEKLSAEEQRLAREIFRHLVTADGTRAPLSIDELRQRLANPRAEAVIDKLVTARLITVSDLDGESNIEVIHDALVSAWPRLQGWIREDVDGARMRDQIRAAARQWDERGRPRGLLWRDEVLLELERWLHREAGVALSDRETAFVEASRRFAAGTKRVRRALLVAAFVVIALFAAFQYRAAREIREAKARADELLTDSYIEQGRHSLLDQEYAKAAAYFEHAMARGRHTPNLEMSFALATRPLSARQLRLSSLPSLINSVKFTTDGNRVITTDNKGVRVWNAATGEKLLELAHKDSVEAQQLPGGTILATAGDDGFVRTWDLTTGNPLLTLSQSQATALAHRVQFRHVVGSLDGKLIAAIDRPGEQVDVWDAKTGELVEEFSTNSKQRFRPAIAFSSDNRWLVASGGEGVQVFDTQTWKSEMTIPIPGLNRMSIDPTGPRVVTATVSGEVVIWDIRTGERLVEMPHSGEEIRNVVFSPDGRLVATGGPEGIERVWNAKTREVIVKLPGTPGLSPSLEFDRTSHLLVSGGSVVTVSDAYTGLPISVLEGSKTGTTAVTFDPVANRVAGVLQDGTVQVWDATAQYKRWGSQVLGSDCLSWGEDRRFVAIGCTHHGTHIWDTAKDLLLADLPSATEPAPGLGIVSPSVSATGDLAAIADHNVVDLYRLPDTEHDTKPFRVIPFHAAVKAIAFARTGHDMVAADVDGSLSITRDEQAPVALPTFAGGVEAVAFAPSGRVLVGGSNRHLRIYDPITTKQEIDYDLGFRVHSFSVAGNGRRMLIIPTAGQQSDAQPILWDFANNRVVSRLDSHKNKLASGRFVRGDTEIITTGGDGITRRWNAETGALLQTYSNTQVVQLDATVSPDGAQLITAGQDGILRFWDITTGRLLWTLHAHKSANALHFEGDQIVSRGIEGDLARWEIPRHATAPGVAVRCLPVRVDEPSATLIEQTCDSPGH